jgi:DNA-binding transcriptional LysR family regulator
MQAPLHCDLLMLDLAQVRCFVVAATELNFRRAAALLNMTQPPLSRQIHLLEHKLGVQLFERVGRTVRLTTEGRVFLADARACCNCPNRPRARCAAPARARPGGCGWASPARPAMN